MGAAVQMDPPIVLGAADALVVAGDGVFGGAVAVDGAVPDIPEDRFGLRQALVGFDEARAAFDRRFADGLHAAGARVTGFALDALVVDGAPAAFPMPVAATPAPDKGR